MHGTKKKIFDKAVELFAEKSYEAVSIQELANALGRRKSGIYNHFSSKQDILHTAYDFFCEYFTADRPTLAQLDPVLKHGTVLDMLRAVHYDFAGEYRHLLLYIYRIIHQRKFSDERARVIVKELMIDSGIQYVEDVFRKAVEIGRLAPFDIHALSVFCNYNRIGFYMSWVADPTPEHQKKLSRDIETLNRYAAMHIVDLKNPCPSDKRALCAVSRTLSPLL